MCTQKGDQSPVYASLQFAELLPSAHIADYHFFHSASLQTEQAFFQTPRSQTPSHWLLVQVHLDLLEIIPVFSRFLRKMQHCSG